MFTVKVTQQLVDVDVVAVAVAANVVWLLSEKLQQQQQKSMNY